MDLHGQKIAFHTLGCKVNIYETEAMEQLVRKAGAVLVPFDGPADIYVINTCTVTNIADRKSRQMIHRAKKQCPEAVVAACGCYAQMSQEDALFETGADLIIGTDEKGRIAEILSDYLNKGLNRAVSDVSKAAVFKPMMLETVQEHTRADVKVQDGCNQFCAYCIIPYARGRIRSKKPEDALREIETLTANGVQEVVLTGIHLSSYGKDLTEPVTLLDLIEQVHALPGVKRIRLGSLEPRIVTEEFAARLSKLEKICPHFHLSLQSGSASVLKRMNRHYSPEEYKESCGILRRFFDDPAITTDVIAGFPGETAEEHRESLAFVKEIGFYELHVFKYSRRKGTVADRMPDQVPEEVKTERSAELIELGEQMSADYRARKCGKRAEMLTEEPAVLNGKTYISGYTKEYIRVLAPEGAGENRILCGTVRKIPETDAYYLEPHT